MKVSPMHNVHALNNKELVEVLASALVQEHQSTAAIDWENLKEYAQMTAKGLLKAKLWVPLLALYAGQEGMKYFYKDKWKTEVKVLSHQIGSKVDVDVNFKQGVISMKFKNKNEAGETITLNYTVNDKKEGIIQVEGNEGSKKGYEPKFAATVNAYIDFSQSEADEEGIQLTILKK